MNFYEVLKKRLHLKKAPLPQGVWRSRFRGRGLEWDAVRPYQSGDEVRAIDWNVTARMGELHVKEFREERGTDCLIALDTSASMACETCDKRLVMKELSIALARSAWEGGDRVGLLLFHDQVYDYLPPTRRGALEKVFFQKVEGMRFSGGTDYLSLAAFCLKHLRRHSFLFCLSDYLSSARGLQELSLKHAFFPVELRAPFEVSFPDVGLVYLQPSEGGDPVLCESREMTPPDSVLSLFPQGVSLSTEGPFMEDFCQQLLSRSVRVG